MAASYTFQCSLPPHLDGLAKGQIISGPNSWLETVCIRVRRVKLCPLAARLTPESRPAAGFVKFRLLIKMARQESLSPCLPLAHSLTCSMPDRLTPIWVADLISSRASSSVVRRVLLVTCIAHAARQLSGPAGHTSQASTFGRAGVSIGARVAAAAAADGPELGHGKWTQMQTDTSEPLIALPPLD